MKKETENVTASAIEAHAIKNMSPPKDSENPNAVTAPAIEAHATKKHISS